MLLDPASHPARTPHHHDRLRHGGLKMAALVVAGAVWRLFAARSLERLEDENDRLVHDLGASLQELSESRARLVTVADGERRRIERDLHDGAQQRLVSIQIHLALLRERLEVEAPARAAALQRIEDEVELATEEVRALAHGIYPPLLTERGLTEALRAAARDAPLPTSVRIGGDVGRYEPEVESTVYFACLEALQNAAKHAEGASGVTIAVTDGACLRFEVRDDGAGFAPGGTPPEGSGLANLRDRLAAVGGEIAVDSTLGAGTCVAGAIPVHAP